MKKYFIATMALFLLLVGCSNDHTNCSDTSVAGTSLESAYDCQDTTGLHIDLDDNYRVVKNQASFDSLVTGNCHPVIDFTKYDLVIGKKALTGGTSSIDYDLVKDCSTTNLKLTVTFTQVLSNIVINVTYHRLIPKLEKGQMVEVKIKTVNPN